MSRFGDLREDALCARPGLGSRLHWRPRWLRSAVVRRLSAELLVQAIGNLESRDDLFWLRRQAWELAHRIVGVDDGYHRFKETGWPLAFETDLAGTIYMPLVERYYGRGRPDVRRPLDRLLDDRWAECWDCYVWSVRKGRWKARLARDLERRWRGGKDGAPGTGVLGGLEDALRRAGRRGADPGLIVARPGLLQSREYDPVLTGLRSRGIPVFWLEIVDASVAGDVDAGVVVAEHAWGVHVSMPLPAPEELIRARAQAIARFAELLAHLRHRCAALPAEWRGLGAIVAPLLPLSVHAWLAATAVAETALHQAAVRFVHVQPDKDLTSRAFVLAARARGIESSYYYRAIELGPPGYWPLADRVLVANAARMEHLRGDLTVPAERMEVVGSLELDGVIGAVEHRRRDGDRSDRIPVLLLTKWPAPLFFGDVERLERLLAEIARWAPRWHWIVKPHPKDTTDYERLAAIFPGRVEVRRDGYAELIAGARLVVSAMGNSVFHALAVGKPLVVFNPDARINLGHDRLFERRDLPSQVRLTTNWPDLLDALRAYASAERLLEPYALASSVVSDLFHSLDGRTAERIVTSLVGPHTS